MSRTRQGAAQTRCGKEKLKIKRSATRADLLIFSFVVSRFVS